MSFVLLMGGVWKISTIGQPCFVGPALKFVMKWKIPILLWTNLRPNCFKNKPRKSWFALSSFLWCPILFLISSCANHHKFYTATMLPPSLQLPPLWSTTYHWCHHQHFHCYIVSVTGTTITTIKPLRLPQPCCYHCHHQLLMPLYHQWHRSRFFN